MHSAVGKLTYYRNDGKITIFARAGNVKERA